MFLNALPFLEAVMAVRRKRPFVVSAADKMRSLVPFLPGGILRTSEGRVGTRQGCLAPGGPVERSLDGVTVLGMLNQCSVKLLEEILGLLGGVARRP